MKVTVSAFINRLLQVERYFADKPEKFASLESKFEEVLPELIELEREVLIGTSEEYNMTGKEKEIGLKIFELINVLGPENPKLLEIKNFLVDTNVEHLSDEQIEEALGMIAKVESELAQ